MGNLFGGGGFLGTGLFKQNKPQEPELLPDVTPPDPAIAAGTLAQKPAAGPLTAVDPDAEHASAMANPMSAVLGRPNEELVPAPGAGLGTPTPMAGGKPPADPAEFKGMFGIKGPARNILGLIGDWSLMRSGNNPMFLPKYLQEQETMRKAKAFEGFDGSQAAFDKAAKFGYAQDAASMSGTMYGTKAQQTAAANAGSKNRYEMTKDMMKQAANALYQAKTPEDVATIKKQLQEQYGELPAVLKAITSPQEAKAFGGGMMSPDAYALSQHRINTAENTQEYRKTMSEQGERNLEIRQQQANTSAYNATKPTGKSGRSNPTARNAGDILYNKASGSYGHVQPDGSIKTVSKKEADRIAAAKNKAMGK